MAALMRLAGCSSSASIPSWKNGLACDPATLFFTCREKSCSRLKCHTAACTLLPDVLIHPLRCTRWHHDADQRRRHGQGLRLETMPQPRNLVGFPTALEENFDRLSVAYGLAFGGENLMKVTAPPL